MAVGENGIDPVKLEQMIVAVINVYCWPGNRKNDGD